MAEAGDRLKRKRSTIRALTTRLLHQIERGIEDENPDINELEEALSQLEIKEDSLKDLDRDIEQGIVNLDDLEAEVEGAQEYQERIITWKCRAKKCIKIHERENNTTRPAAAQESVASASVKLPRLTLDKFYGNAENWQGFWNQFSTAIHDNGSLTKTDKFNYLRSYLGGTAANAVSGLALADHNYDAAVKILTDRFGRKDLIINTHMNRLLNLTAVNKSSDVEALRKLYDVCEVQVRSLESLGVVTDTYGTLLCPVLMKVLPDDITLEFSRRRDADSEWNVRELLRFLRLEIECRERAILLNKPNPSKDIGKGKSQEYHTRNGNKYKKSQFSFPSTAALSTSSETQSRCIFCNTPNHKSENCKELSIDEKRDKLKKQGRCFVCLGTKHIARFCKVKISCSTCGRRHNKAVCNQVTEGSPEGISNDTVASTVSQMNIYSTEKETILLQTATAMISGCGGNKIGRCLLDGGSQRTFIREDVSRSLNLPLVGEETLMIHTFGSDTPRNMKLRKVKVLLSNIRNCNEQIELLALEIPRVCGAVVNIPGEEIRKELDAKDLMLADVSTHDYKTEPSISILIGGDYYWKVVSGRVERLGGSLVALETIFGWCVQGPSTTSITTLGCSAVSILKVVTQEELVSDQLRTFWELESLGISEKTTTPSDADKEVLNTIESQIEFKDGRYEVRLPWKQEKEYLCDNYEVARKRLLNLVKKFQTDKILYSRYKREIEEQIREGIVEPVPESDDTTKETYYLPHHAVTKENKDTTKLRVVFDASSSKIGCPSLNDCLFAGPNLNPELLTVLLKFRHHKVAFMSDIQKAFLQISLAEEDRDVTRFLWPVEPLTDKEDQQIQIYRMTRVLFGVSSSPCLLAATIRHHLKKYEDSDPEICRLLKDCFYVDDLISGAPDVEEAFRVSKRAKTIMQSAKMHLRKWNTNSEELLSRWEQSDFETKKGFNSNTQEVSPLKVLGLTWNTDSDEFRYDLHSLLEFLKQRNNTKRYVLQVSARIFDPIGFLSPFTVRVKCLFQEMWEQGIEWDEKLPDALLRKWEQWCLELPRLQDVVIPRFYYQDIIDADTIKEKQLHCFCDASERAYGAVVYLRYITVNGHVGISLVTSKARVAPLKRLTIPRLELMGALIGARLVSHVRESLGLSNSAVHMWSDSTITLHWIRGSSRQWKPFVSNRVTEVQTLTDPQAWSHCSGRDNPADLLSRGQTVGELINGNLWWRGPIWLSMDDDQWPQGIPENDKVLDSEIERKPTSSAQMNCNMEESRGQLLILEKFSSLRRVLRITAWSLRFVNNLRNTSDRKTGQLTAEELRNAEIYWIKDIQRQAFEPELNQLKANKPIPKDSKLADLSPFLDEHGLICVGGRLQQADFSFAERHPRILPEKHRLCELLIIESHEQVLHSGLRDTLVQLREKYWIPRGRQLVKLLIKRCQVCRKFNVRPGSQIMAPLPRERITEAPPFEVTGIDFAGPLYSKGNHKAYIALFTCAVTRAVHLELVSDLRTETFMLALRRFLARRGMCKTIYSDNAMTFKRANQDLKSLWKAISSPQLQDFYGKNGISWKFIVERAAWWGGFWERLVRSVKTCLRKTLGKTSLTFEELQTKLTEVEAVLNSRPITFTYNDVSDPSPLTPAHFLIGGRLTSLPPHSPRTFEISSTKEQLTRKLRYQNELLNRLWVRWRKEYLLELRSAMSSHSPKEIREMKVDDVVFINEKTPRHMWKIGRICEVYRGRDDKVRSCALRLASGTVLKRPIQLLYPLELSV